jgi:chemotaxis methyl-accepting protein methylase
MTKLYPPSHLVGIGASAGGLESLSALLPSLASTGSMAYLIAQHMGQTAHADLLLRLLNQNSALPVVLAADGMPITADTVYLLPAGMHGEVVHNHIQLIPRGPDTFSCPSATRLFRSIAEHYGSRGVAIVLSGTGTDGAAGCSLVHAAGGLALAQRPDTAIYDGMPQAALATGNAMASTLEALPAAIYRILHDKSDAETVAQLHAEAAVDELMQLLFNATGVDMRGYKQETLLRRTRKRIADLRLPSLNAYLSYARRNNSELHELRLNLFVTVSKFFRDVDAFSALGSQLDSWRVANPAEHQFRLWVAGCGAGEELFSLMMLVQSMLDRHANQCGLIGLGTDLNVTAIKQAIAGRYPEKALMDMPMDLRTRFMRRISNEYEVDLTIRHACHFECADIMTGPFAQSDTKHYNKFDLVSCRNVLIYLKQPLQDQLLHHFHRHLQPNGLLFLGQSESLTPAARALFTPVDASNRIFRRR